MLITFVGHAGFVVETEGAVVVADPWLSPSGAFDSGWMQLPENGHLAPFVREKLATPGKARFVYLSHEHQDHFDPEFLASLPTRDFTLVIPRLRGGALGRALTGYGARVVECADGESIPFAGGSLRLFVEDRTLNRDSALLVKADGHSFLDLNDCKMHDRLGRVRDEEGPIDVFTAQFSGAVWHPTCYAYERKQFTSIAKRKRISKFEAVARALDAVNPRMFLSSAGPACFLDPALFHLNLDREGIFPGAPEFYAYLRKRLKRLMPTLVEPAPGDAIDLATMTVREGPGPRPREYQSEAYLRAYAARRAPLFEERERAIHTAEPERVLAALKSELAAKLDALVLRSRVALPLYVTLEELPGRHLVVDFGGRRVEDVAEVPASGRYTLRARAGDVARVLDRRLSWEAYLLSFRHAMSRDPDRYDPIMHGFLALEAEDLPAFCDAVLHSESQKERTTIEAADGRRWSIQRYCPHQGADLSAGWVQGSCLVCPRHRWRFDLEEDGRCVDNAASVHARAVEEPAAVPVGDEGRTVA